ncbi:MAG: EAL domain-containing protein, partial [Acidimicrobiales bacterium]
AFVSSTDPGLHDPTIVESITELGHAFGLEVVAEGIETEEQRLALVALGIKTGQGYLFGRPARPDQLIDWHGQQLELNRN